MTKLSRRDFLKLAGTLSASTYFSHRSVPWRSSEKSNVLIILFDTMSARHLSLYGYGRQTTPNLERFAERATVYHSHYSGGNFTTPATGALLLGMYPWTHRAFTHGGLVRRELVGQTLFALFGEEFYRFSFAQTWYANILLQQFLQSVDRNLPSTSFSISGRRFVSDHLLRESSLSTFLLDDFATQLIPDMPGTLLGGYLSTTYNLRHGDYYRHGFADHPLGIPFNPNTNLAFRLEDVFAGVYEEIRSMSARQEPYSATSIYTLRTNHPSRAVNSSICSRMITSRSANQIIH